MKKLWRTGAAVCGFFCLVLCGFESQAWSEEDTIPQGIVMEDMDLSGLTVEEAKALIEECMAEIESREITLIYDADKSYRLTAGELGITWEDQATIEQIAGMGNSGNVVSRFLQLEELQQAEQEYPLVLSIDEATVRTVLEEQCVPFDLPAQEPYLTREDGTFTVHSGTEGTVLNLELSENQLADYLTGDWNRENAEFVLSVDVAEIVWTEDSLTQVQDVLGSYSTSYRTSGESRSANVEIGRASCRERV